MAGLAADVRAGATGLTGTFGAAGAPFRATLETTFGSGREIALAFAGATLALAGGAGFAADGAADLEGADLEVPSFDAAGLDAAALGWAALAGGLAVILPFGIFPLGGATRLPRDGAAAGRGVAGMSG